MGKWSLGAESRQFDIMINLNAYSSLTGAENSIRSLWPPTLLAVCKVNQDACSNYPCSVDHCHFCARAERDRSEWKRLDVAELAPEYQCAWIRAVTSAFGSTCCSSHWRSVGSFLICAIPILLIVLKVLWLERLLTAMDCKQQLDVYRYDLWIVRHKPSCYFII